jgi:hypothetical protein
MRNNRRPQRRQEQLIVDALAAGRSEAIDNTRASASVRVKTRDFHYLNCE